MNARQKKTIIRFMKKNYKDLNGKHSSLKGPASKNKIWKELADNLNLLGPPSKSMELWQQYCCTIKSKMEKKYGNVSELYLKESKGRDIKNVKPAQTRHLTVTTVDLTNDSDDVSDHV